MAHNNGCIECKFCKGRNVVKKGLQQTKFGCEQLFYCNDCDRKFSLRGIRNKVYGPKIITCAISAYNLEILLRKPPNASTGDWQATETITASGSASAAFLINMNVTHAIGDGECDSGEACGTADCSACSTTPPSSGGGGGGTTLTKAITVTPHDPLEKVVVSLTQYLSNPSLMVEKITSITVSPPSTAVTSTSTSQRRISTILRLIMRRLISKSISRGFSRIISQESGLLTTITGGTS
ncbi:MAG: hypothetical protein ABIF85_07305 [Nanoarchaeota archaeon]